MGVFRPELLIILAIAILILGPKKLPQIGSAIGQTIKEFRKGKDEIALPESEMTSLKNAKLGAPKEALEEIR